jgi:hypothetical protein
MGTVFTCRNPRCSTGFKPKSNYPRSAFSHRLPKNTPDVLGGEVERGIQLKTTSVNNLMAKVLGIDLGLQPVVGMPV